MSKKTNPLIPLTLVTSVIVFVYGLVNLPNIVNSINESRVESEQDRYLNELRKYRTAVYLDTYLDTYIR